MTRIRSIYILTVVSVLACASPEEEAAPLPVPEHVRVERREIGESRQGRPIEAVFVGDGPRVVLLVATIHGNEAAGTPLLEELPAWFRAHPAEVEGRTVVLVPVANPDGRHRGTRANAAGVDLNRNWPSANWTERAGRASRWTGPKPLSEPESRALHGLIEQIRPAVVVSIHQPLACVDWDGPAEELAATMSELSGLPVRKLGARPGSMGSCVGVDRGIPIVTLELPRDVDAATAREIYSAALRRAVAGSAISPDPRPGAPEASAASGASEAGGPSVRR